MYESNLLRNPGQLLTTAKLKSIDIVVLLVLTEQNYYAAQLLPPQLLVLAHEPDIDLYILICAAYTCCIHKLKFSWFAAVPYTNLLKVYFSIMTKASNFH